MIRINTKDTICERISFLSDGLTLTGTLHLPRVEAPPTVIGSHGLFSSGDSPKQVALALRLNKHGIAFFRFDHRGCGRSQGDFGRVTSLESRMYDLRCAVQLIRDRRDTGNIIGLFGSSMGGTVCLALAKILGARALVTVAAPVDSASVSLSPAENEMPPDGVLNKNAFCFDISGHLAEIHNCMIFHGDNDDVVPVSHAKRIYRNATGARKLIIQKSGDHRMSDVNHQQALVRQATAWFVQYLTRQSRNQIEY
jgi:alpha/beta superfamily hydrolase